jgi:uncharacterized RmlC-like cupin family protein
MTTTGEPPSQRPIVVRQGVSAISAVGRYLVIHEWTGSGPDFMHVHHSDDEAWHVLEGCLRFEFQDGAAEAPVGTTVFVPAGVPHTYKETEPCRYLIFLTPRLDRLVAELHSSPDESRLAAILARYDTDLVERRRLETAPSRSP